MLRISVVNDAENKEFEHPGGPLEFGRGPRRDVERYVVVDPFMSRDHLRIEEADGGLVALTNLSLRNPLTLEDGRVLGAEETCRCELPLAIVAGKTRIRVESPLLGNMGGIGTTLADESLDSEEDPRIGATTQGLPNLVTLRSWFETVIIVQQAAAESNDFHHRTARAVVEQVGLDRGLVLVRDRDSAWKIAAMYPIDDASSGAGYSQSILDRVVAEKRCFDRQLEPHELRGSLANIEAVVAAPVVDRQQQVSAVVYGSRYQKIGRDLPVIQPLEAQLMQVLAAAVGAGLARERKEAEALRQRHQFEQFVSRELASELSRDPTLLEGREREITCLFSDVRNSTSIAERLGPRETVRMMQDVMELQGKHIRAFDGTVVDYYGDGLLAMWNAPFDQPNHAELACRAVEAFMNELDELGERWLEKIGHPLRLGVGLNTGTALVGNTGSPIKLKYGPMGPTVNLASRVEQATKHLGVSVLITEATRSRLGPSFAVRRLCQAMLLGVAAPVNLYEFHGAGAPADWLAKRDRYETALDHFEQKRWTEAYQEIYPLLTQSTGQHDAPSLQLLSRAVDCLKNRPERFDPVVRFSVK